MQVLFWICASLIAYTWTGYPLLLWIWNAVRRSPPAPAKPPAAPPPVTVMVTVHNEEAIISKRLSNLGSLEYSGPLNFLIVSDGSTDATEIIVEELAQRDPRFQLFRTPRLGKSGAQNQALRKITSEVVVLGDADCLFRADYVQAVVRTFADRQVGCVTGNLMLVTEDGAIAGSLEFYWRFEQVLRRLESESGLLATASGQCMAIRRAAFSPFEPVYGDDCVIPLDMRIQGMRTIYAAGAVAYGSMPATVDGELKARIRMTTRNLLGTLSRPALFNPFRFPGVAWALISHKLLRWFTPVFLLFWLAPTVYLAPRGGIYLAALIGQAALYCLAGLGWALDIFGKKELPVSSQAYSFMLANVGFSLGLAAAFQRRQITAYK